MKRVKLGDIFEIPLSGGRKAYGRYLMMSKLGPIVQIFSVITKNKVEVDQVVKTDELFPPIITGLFAAIREGIWRFVGNILIEGPYQPQFIGTNFTPEGKATNWYFWDGDNYKNLGAILPEEYRRMEFLVVWAPQDVAKRIESGEIPFPFGELINYNEFKPKI